jgi:glycosyltransferase involved in cell wall biosynthesis
MVKVVLINSQSLYSYNLYKELLKHNEKLNLLFYGPKHSRERVSCSFANAKKLWTQYFYPFQIFKQAIIDKPDIAHIQYEVNTFGPFHTNLLFPLLIMLLRISRVKVVITIHSVFTEFEREFFPTLFRMFPPSLVRIILYLFYMSLGKLANRIIVHSSVFKTLLTRYYKLPENKLRIIPHGVINAVPIINRTKLDSWSSRFHNKKIILYFGVLSPRKGLEYLIRSFQEITLNFPESVLIIAGYEPDYYHNYKKSLEELTKSLGLEHKVFFTGFIKDEDIHVLFSMAEIIVLPYVYSVSASGPLSIAIQHRKPIVATKTAFFSEILLNECDAILVPPRDVRALTKAIAKLLGDSSTREILSKNLAIKAHYYSWQRIAENTLNEYFDLVAGTSKNARVSIDNYIEESE